MNNPKFLLVPAGVRSGVAAADASGRKFETARNVSRRWIQVTVKVAANPARRAEIARK
jgi:hypothetical protein